VYIAESIIRALPMLVISILLMNVSIRIEDVNKRKVAKGKLTITDSEFKKMRMQYSIILCVIIVLGHVIADAIRFFINQ